jgi:colanic acid/amylovoran biosynthesis glycosyltransferase
VDRIAYLLSQYPAVNHVFMLRDVRLLRKLGFEIHVASIRKPDRDVSLMTAAEQEEARSTYCVKATSLGRLVQAHFSTLLSRPRSFFGALFGAMGRDGTHGLFYFAEAVVVGDWMRRGRISHVHTHYVSTVGLIVKQIFPVTLSITFHGPAEFENVVGSNLREKVAASLFSCGISQFGLGQLMYASGFAEWPKLELTPLGVDPDDFPPRPFRANPSPFQIVCVGRLAPVKGQHLLVEAMERLVKSGRNIRLRLAGDGPDRAALQQDVRGRGLENHILFEGNLNQDKLRELYRESDALVLASFAEGLPVVLMEAMAMEIPCVAPWVNGIPEIITHETDGLMVPPGDAAALAGAIGRLMDDAVFRQALGQKARSKVLEKFTLQLNTEHLADIFRRRLKAAHASQDLPNRESS